MTHSAEILADSMSPDGVRLTTLKVTHPRYILAEVNTHRMISKSSASSRAIPVAKMLERFRNDLHVPIHWGKNQKGMQAEEELSPLEQLRAEAIWRDIAASNHAGVTALMAIGVHKQIANRWLEPGLWHTSVLTATEWDNFFHLRNHPAAHPEFKRLAEVMIEAMIASTPRLLNYEEWHLPYVDEETREAFSDQDPAALPLRDLPKCSAGRCARVSYLTQDGKRDPQDHIELCDRLLAMGHMAPLEHPARPMTPYERKLFMQKRWEWAGPQDGWIWNSKKDLTHFLGNFNGWVQLRKLIPNEHDILGAR